MDFNLYGMDFIYLSKFKFRSPIPSQQSSHPKLITIQNVENDSLWPPSHPLFHKKSHCDLEVDTNSLGFLSFLFFFFFFSISSIKFIISKKLDIMNEKITKSVANPSNHQLVTSLSAIWKVSIFLHQLFASFFLSNYKIIKKKRMKLKEEKQIIYLHKFHKKYHHVELILAKKKINGMMN